MDREEEKAKSDRMIRVVRNGKVIIDIDSEGKDIVKNMEQEKD